MIINNNDRGSYFVDHFILLRYFNLLYLCDFVLVCA